MQYKMPTSPAPLRRFWAILLHGIFLLLMICHSYFELGSKDKAKAYAVEPTVREVVAAIRYPTALLVEVTAAATQNTVNTTFCYSRIFFSKRTIISIPIATPFPYTATHIVNAKPIS
jgi:hypothetical protein